MKRTLVCGPWFGEIGLFVMWVGGCRYMAKRGQWDRVVVIGPTGWGAMVQDFADEYVAHPFTGIIACGCHGKQGTEPPMEAVEACVREAAQGKPYTWFPAVETHPVDTHPGNRFREPMGDRAIHIAYGTQRAKYKDCVVFHARWRLEWGDDRNWPAERWAALMGELKAAHPTLRVACIGSREGAMLVNGADDYRGIPVDELLDLLASARLVVGPSSGPLHLASLCDTPHVTWVGYGEKKRPILVNRYMRDWRPHGTPLVCIAKADWNPPVATVWDAVRHMLAEGGTRRAKQATIPAQVPIFVLCYGGLCDTIAALQSIELHTTMPHALIVLDNSDDWNHATWLAEHMPHVTYLRMGRNVGCTVPRNLAANYARWRSFPSFVFMDQDVTVTESGWLRDMVGTLDAHQDTGCVAWPLSNAVKPEHPVGPTGEVPEVPGLCNLYRTQAALQVPWDERFFMYRFDSLHCLLMGKRGWKTRIVQGRGDKIAHATPHSGVNRNPEKDKHRRRSEALFQRLLAEYKIADPFVGACV